MKWVWILGGQCTSGWMDDDYGEKEMEESQSEAA
jgi:hypothetical protein